MGAARSRSAHRLLPRSLRRPAAVVAVACAVVLTALSVRYHGGDRPGAFDRWVYGELLKARLPNGPLTRVADLVAPTFAGLAAVLTLVLAARRRWRPAALTTLGPGLALLTTEVAKRLVGRSLDGMLALPSGHTTGVASVVAVIALLQIGRAEHLRRAAVLGLLAVTMAAAVIGVLMVALHFHYATDVLAGSCVAVAVPLAVAFAIDAMPNLGRGGVDGSPDDRFRSTASGTPAPCSR